MSDSKNEDQILKEITNIVKINEETITLRLNSQLREQGNLTTENLLLAGIYYELVAARMSKPADNEETAVLDAVKPPTTKRGRPATRKEVSD